MGVVVAVAKKKQQFSQSKKKSSSAVAVVASSSSSPLLLSRQWNHNDGRGKSLFVVFSRDIDHCIATEGINPSVDD